MAVLTLSEQASAIKERAVRHKRKARFHKQQARQAMEELTQFCKEHNIALIQESNVGVEGELHGHRLPAGSHHQYRT